MRISTTLGFPIFVERGNRERGAENKDSFQV